MAGRVVDEAGAGVADAHVWAVVGTWGGRVSRLGETDGKGRFVLPKAWDKKRPRRRSRRPLGFLRGPPMAVSAGSSRSIAGRLARTTSSKSPCRRW